MINLVFEGEVNFEYDIRGLIMSFYPGEKIIVDTDNQGMDMTDLKMGEETESLKTLVISYPNRKCTSLTFYSGKKDPVEMTESVDFENRKDTKSVLKRMLYQIFSEDTKVQLPWGTLTGIRPTKIPMSMLERGCPEEEVKQYLHREYQIGEEKAALSIDIAKTELRILHDIDYKEGYSLYIGIPFCPSTCLYCSFTSYPLHMWESRLDDYLSAIEKEIEFAKISFRDKKLTSIYIGGGTPTTLSAARLDWLLAKIEESFDFTCLREFTVEAGRPDSITKEKLQVIAGHKADRISINPQTMNQSTLDLIGRKHTAQEIKEVYHIAREIGDYYINMDIILGLPGETVSDVHHTMEELYHLGPDNVTVHSLALKRASRLNLYKEDYNVFHNQEAENMMSITSSYAGKMGMEPYYLYRQKNMAGNLENVGYARPGKEGIYNILMMEEKQSIVALGAGSASKAVWPDGSIKRTENVKDIKQYLERIDEMIERKRILFGV